jgi:hypothetical protein
MSKERNRRANQEAKNILKEATQLTEARKTSEEGFEKGLD